MSNGNLSQQPRLLFFGSVMVLFVGMGLFPVLPLYAAELGASRITIDLLFSL
ncbi:MAG: hypothetical protein IT318_00645 [Anaerolineales bacterium]|nr:hypothetical protein [Anaerolineales bacterium]